MKSPLKQLFFYVIQGIMLFNKFEPAKEHCRPGLCPHFFVAEIIEFTFWEKFFRIIFCVFFAWEFNSFLLVVVNNLKCFFNMKFSFLSVCTYTVVVVNSESCVWILLNFNKENTFADCVKSAGFNVVTFAFFYFNAVYFINKSSVVYAFNEIFFCDIKY